MIKDILVQIPTERPMRPAIDGAVSLAAGCNAHLDAVSVGYVATSTAYVIEGGTAVAAVFEMERAENALTKFETEARHAGISYSWQPVGTIPADAIDMVGAASTTLASCCSPMQI